MLKSLKELFSNINADKIQKKLNEYNIEVPENYQFSEINIVIGPNGSGKTRFLKAVKELYGLHGENVIYGYFPALSDHKISAEECGGELPEWTLYEAMINEDVSFSDFFKEIERQNEGFIPALLIYQSKRQKKLGEETLQIVYESFRALTGKKLTRQGEQLLVSRPDGSQGLFSDVLKVLSPGELMLFYMSIFLAIQQNGKKNKVIILDEPESHLHPKALLSFITLLQKTSDFKEIWIATHSLFLVPKFPFETITYICDSAIQSRTSQIYQNIFSEILGDEDGEIRTFFSSLAQWQYCEFMAECFTDPTVIDTVNVQDEQVQLFIDCLKQHKPYRILDCGGGSGRLGLSLKVAQNGEMKDICYEIYDRNPTYKGEEFAVYTDLEKIKGPYDCVVMMNFLHEVEPKEWVNLFCEVHNLMKATGHLVFVEVAALRQGEMPNKSGYFVLGKEELEILFGCPQQLEEIRHKEKQKSCCILIPREKLTMVTVSSVKTAIWHLRRRMLNEIKVFRKKESKGNIDDRSGRHFAFLTQQYINAELFSKTYDAVERKEKVFQQRQSKEMTERKRRMEEMLEEVYS